MFVRLRLAFPKGTSPKGEKATHKRPFLGWRGILGIGFGNYPSLKVS